MKIKLSDLLEKAKVGDHQAQYSLSCHLMNYDESAAKYWLLQAVQGGLSEAKFTSLKLDLIQCYSFETLEQIKSEFYSLSMSGFTPAIYEYIKLMLLDESSSLNTLLAEFTQLFKNVTPSEVHNFLELCYKAINFSSASNSTRDLLNERPNLNSNHEGLKIKEITNLIPYSICEMIIKTQQPFLSDSTVLDPVSNKKQQNPIRQSKGNSLDLSSMGCLEALILRIVSDKLKISWRKCEPINILKYEKNDHYKAHHDCFEFDPLNNSMSKNNNRKDTCILYLNTGYKGGKTRFPALELDYYGDTGSTLYFQNMTDGKPDKRMVHEGLPILDHQPKWIMTFWFREKNLIQ